MTKMLGFILVAAGILIYATLLLVGIPYFQLAQVESEEALKPYTEHERVGRQVYISSGCIYCHSQQPRESTISTDDIRNWGRPATPGDYKYDYPHLLGTMRTGPDLLNIGVRQPSEDWHLVHLFQPRAVLPTSVMPAFPYMFELKESASKDDKVVRVPEAFVPKNKIVVAGPKALALVAYLKSLKRNYPTRQLEIFKKIKESSDE